MGGKRAVRLKSATDAKVSIEVRSKKGLKATQPEMLFSPLALPDVEVKVSKKGKNGGEARVILNGVALSDRKRRTTEYKLQLESRPFPVRGYKRVAVKVVDVYRNESTVVRELAP